MGELEGCNVLVTGGAGSIGSEIVKKAITEEAAVVRALDADESGLFELARELSDDATLRTLLGDVRDLSRLRMAIEDIDVVFHAAALKHVGLNEYNPFEAVQTNVRGTQNIIRASLEADVESFVTISTDKATHPVSVMGATKLLSERLVIAANAYKGSDGPKFGCVRFGNVIGTSGSVVPKFIDQIADGGPVTVTDPEMTRFIMPPERAVELVLTARRRMRSGEVFVLKMNALRIGDLAEAMIEHYAPQFGHSPEEVEIEIVGPRPGERVHEKLISAEETVRVREYDQLYAILPQINISGYQENVDYEDAKPIDFDYTSANEELLGKSEILEMIEETL
jgi:FlaA1/EpsC-like NDP-sugar epimerase